MREPTNGGAGEAGYTEKDMPKNRFDLFMRVLWDHLFDLVKVNAMQLVFWIPFLIWTGLNFAALQSAAIAAVEAAENGTQAELLPTLSGQMLVWLLGLIPCIAITGPSSAGAAYVMRNWARDEHAFLFSDFVDAFKSNWKQALGVSALTSLVPVSAFAAVAYYGALAAQNKLMVVPLAVALTVAGIFTLMLPLLYPMMIGYKLRFRDLLQNGALMALARLPQMLLTRLATALPIAVLLYGIYAGSPMALLIVSLYYLTLGFAFSRLLYASVANAVFDRYLNPNIEGAPVRVGLMPLDDDDDEEDEDDDDDDDDDDEDEEYDVEEYDDEDEEDDDEDEEDEEEDDDDDDEDEEYDVEEYDDEDEEDDDDEDEDDD